MDYLTAPTSVNSDPRSDDPVRLQGGPRVVHCGSLWVHFAFTSALAVTLAASAPSARALGGATSRVSGLHTTRQWPEQ